MADLYGGTNTPPIESEEMSSILHNLLHNSYYSPNTGDDDFSFGEDSLPSEAPENPVPTRSTKRTRAAEIHNLSEKRRRSKINEKLKALQNLIPNSNKTDKASMLDEAIEYLKQLQLQVQMLTMRNGLSLQPVYLPEKLEPIHPPPRGADYNEGDGLLNQNRGNIFPGNQEIFIPSSLHISSHTSQNQPDLIRSTTNITNSETSYGIEPLFQNHYGLLNHLTPRKDICRMGSSSSQVQLDATSSGKNPSSGVS